ncbi:MAG: cell surface protein SprA [Bacteroidetes bacterium]|nr:cell surface protein SprA [Bacteroidota bacterium]
MRIIRYIISLLFITTFAAFIFQVPMLNGKPVDASSYRYSPDNIAIQPPDSSLKYPFPKKTQPFNGDNPNHPMYLREPSNVKDSIVYDPVNNEYIFNSKIGDLDYNTPNTMSFDEYQTYDIDKSLQNYWRERSKAANAGNRGGLIPQFKVGSEVFEKIFGSNTIDIRPQGSAELIFAIIGNKRDDPSIDTRNRTTTNFDFQEKIQMSVLAKIGDKIEFKMNYNTESMFAFENKLKLRYEGKEDEILQLLEAGDINFPLNTTLIQGSQSLFGIKTKLKFGRTTITSVFSEQKAESKNITVQGGAETNKFKIKADQYEENKHFFLAQYFRDNYNKAMSSIPIIGSNINITKIEVWRTNIGAPTTNNRNIVAFTDLGENNPSNSSVLIGGGSPKPANKSNNLYNKLTSIPADESQVRNINTVSNFLSGATYGYVSGQDFEKVESAKKLAPNEYYFNSKLGFISLNSTLNSDQVLAVAFQYTIAGDTTIYQVGEFSDQGISDPKALIVKLIKSTTLNTHGVLWKLMMKNVYSLGAYQVNRQDFRLNILYTGEKGGVATGFFNEGPKKGIALIRLLHLDTLDAQLNPTPDGVFDFIDNAATLGGTMQSNNGRVYFPLIEPFGRDLRNILGDQSYADKFCYDSLYSLTKTEAQQFPDKNKYILEGIYKSASGSEISLGGFNIPQGSVKVTSGGMPLTENVDYTVDYTLGRVRIINEGILNSGAPINISLESNSMFNIMTKRMMGTHVDYEVNKDFTIGATIMNLHQSPLTQKVNYGDEPISNTIWGFDINYQTESRLLTKMVDALPFIQTKAPSKITFYGEFAQFIPGHSSAIGSTGTSYIDDFEGSKSSIDMKNMGTWFMASTPQGQTQSGMFPECSLGFIDSLAYGFNRAKLAWYVIDPMFYRSDTRPANISKSEISQPYEREVLEREVFPNKELPNGQAPNISVLNLAYYPDERGPYNYDVAGIAGISSGINPNGTLKNPNERWGGIMRKIETTDFDATNVEYIEFWMMDPFIQNTTHSGGQLYFNLGDVSEDILRDGRKSFENGLPTSAVVTNVDTTIWGRVPKLQALVNSFDNNSASRPFQDVGYDGLRTVDEVSFFDKSYIQKIVTVLGTTSQAYSNAMNDPSADNYHYFRGSDFDQNPVYSNILTRYKNYNGPDGNSPTSDQSTESYPTNATTMPNVEDINIDNTLSEAENYYQYVIDLKPSKMEIGTNFITDINYAQGVALPDGSNTNVKWYQFKIPIRTPDKTIGKIQNFQSIRFIRMFLKGFSQPIICRFATLELVRGEWRKYSNQLLTPGDYITGDQSGTTFNVSAVNIEENGKRSPVPYVIPPGITREQDQTSTNFQKLNEQSLSMKVTNLIDGDARAIYKTTEFDFRQFKYLKMYVHAEKGKAEEDLKYGDLNAFIRIGSDFTQNYYEIEIPLLFTPWGTSDAASIWPDANEMIIDLAKIVAVKEKRNVLVRSGNPNINNYYIEVDGKYKYTIVGSPSISNVNTIMIGVRNPKKRLLSDNDDMLPKSAEVWINELRLTDFNEKTGWAATSRIRANLADLGDVSVSGTYSTAGFGSIEQKINETQKDNITSYDLATNLELGKFFSEKIGLKIPMHYDYSKSISNPEYNPLDPDVKLEDDLATYQTETQRDSIRQLVQDYTTRKNINFINVRKERVGATKRNRYYDIENFDASYSYSEIYHRNIDIEYDIKKTYKGGIGYNFSKTPKNVRPFEKIGFISKYSAFSLIKAFNFNYEPKMLSFRTEMFREFDENKLRNKSSGLIIIEPTYFKRFEWSRIYGLRYDPAQSVQFEYNAIANATIDEPQGRIDTKEKRDSVWNNILDLGRPQRFTQNISINYNIPINKIKPLDWLTAQARYGADYRWEASPLSLQERMGNTIENNNAKQLNFNVSMTSIFNKVKYLEKLNKGDQTSRTPVQPNRRGKTNIQTKTNPLPAEENDSIKKKPNQFKNIGDGILKFIMGFKTASINFTENNGTLIPGFMPSPVAIGNNWNKNAPGLGYIFGSQEDIRETAAAKNWLSTDTLSNNPYLTKYTTTVNARASFEPIPDLKIEFTATRTYTENTSQYYRVDPNSSPRIVGSIPTTTGSFSISFMSILTSFSSDNEDYSNATFQKFLDNRQIIATRLANANPNWNGQYKNDTLTGQLFPVGYGSTTQQVLIPAFLAAYSGRDPNSIGLNPFPKIPIPNWTLNYTGLSKIKALKNLFKTISISNGYHSTYSVGSFTNNILSKEDANGNETVKNMLGNYVSKKQIDQVSISEQFSPLFRIELSWVNSLLTNIEFKKSRNLSLSFTNNQLTELTSNEFIVGLGYRIKDVEIIIGKLLKSDITLKLDFSIRSNKTVLRRIDQNINQISQGQQVISLNFSADYMLNERFTLRAFFDKVINNPFISSSFPNSTTNAGISIRFSLAQ